MSSPDPLINRARPPLDCHPHAAARKNLEKANDVTRMRLAARRRADDHDAYVECFTCRVMVLAHGKTYLESDGVGGLRSHEHQPSLGASLDDESSAP